MLREIEEVANTSIYRERRDEISFDDDGRVKRTGTWITATAHIVTAVIGSGVLSLAWAVAQLGWIGGPLSILVFSGVSCFSATIIADCYRNRETENGNRNYSYMDAIRSYLGRRKSLICGITFYCNLVGVTIGYTITASLSMGAIIKSYGFHKHGHGVGCHTQNSPFMIIFGVIQVVLSQLPDFDKLFVLSIIDPAISLSYTSIALGLSVAKVAGGAHIQKSSTGVPVGKDMSGMDQTWNIFSAFGDIAFAYCFTYVVPETQDTLKSHPPENKVMKQAAFIGISISTILYILCGLLGYAAFGDNAPESLLDGFGFFEPFWLVDLANICIIVHLAVGYQVYCKHIFGLVEHWRSQMWPSTRSINAQSGCNFSYFRLAWRTTYVIFTTILAMMFPFFNDVVGLLGATSFWPLTVYFPIQMFIAQAKIPNYSSLWICLQILNFSCLVMSLLAAVGSVHGLVKSIQKFKLFHSFS